jgi:hypothetical protein
VECALFARSGRDDLQLLHLHQVEELFVYRNSSIVMEQEGFEREAGTKWFTVVFQPKEPCDFRYSIHPSMFRNVVTVGTFRKWRVKEVINAGTPRAGSKVHGKGVAVVIFKVFDAEDTPARDYSGDLELTFSDGKTRRFSPR